MRQISVQEALALSKRGSSTGRCTTRGRIFQRKHPGAINIPAEELEDHAELWKQDKTVYLFCHTGRKSAECVQDLEKEGKNVVDVEGGIPLVSEVFFESVYKTGRKPRRTHGTD